MHVHVELLVATKGMVTKGMHVHVEPLMVTKGMVTKATVTKGMVTKGMHVHVELLLQRVARPPLCTCKIKQQWNGGATLLLQNLDSKRVFHPAPTVGTAGRPFEAKRN